ncbi:hypothetical protein GEV33_004763 [Tenebrio molitor]|uniref:Uncharacterized protein n=2 Tax=Tenebrio molitor TaxID=7067 RepID=A0A8J6HQX2_TENMO|nr:hypothetical protein GEV33_004763 [Tenebrio molitor]
MGPKGCLLTELPSLTVLYIPEQLALELTSDCGLDGTKRIACKGNADREDLLKQLTCAISPDDFDDKSTKSPITSYTASSAVSEISSEDVSSSSKTTKPWIWTSNTIDIDYGMPTRHRRETEDTLSPGSTKSTTDLSTHESHNKNKLTTSISNPSYDTETTSISPERDVTLDSSVSLRSDKPSELKTTQVTDLTTQDVNTQPAETSGSAAATVEPKALEAGVEDTGEYPSAIGQGQLFSIIENGTMFDIIEVNETTSDDLKLDKEIKMETPQSDSEISKTTSTARYSTDHNDNLYTTVVYHKEPPSETSFVTNKSVKKADKHSKKQMFKEKDSKKVNPQIFNKPMNNLENKENDKTLNKEVEMFPIMTDSMVKLNRTHRKELPLIEEDENKAEEENPLKTSTNLNLFNSNEADSVEHQHIEIKWHEGENKNLIHITTKRVDANKKSSTTTKQNIELFNNTEDDRETLHKIDSKIDRLNSIMNSTAANNDTEMFAPPKPEKIQTLPDESMLMKEQFLPKSLLGETKDKPDTTSASLSSNEPLEPEPQAQPRPNRQRQLTRPQRRSFYPYFFSRVLG